MVGGLWSIHPLSPFLVGHFSLKVLMHDKFVVDK
jgi:hypothetical protein